jgi:hypothetical protein
MLLKAHALLFSLFLALLAILPASAQGFNAEEVRRINQAKKNMPNIGRAYSIRVTTGATSNAGFEKSLVGADPNLKHWCWVPVTSMKQAYIHVAPGQTGKGAQPGQTNYVRPKSVYVKPNHVPLPKVDHGSNQVVIRTGGSWPSRSSSDVSATITYNKPVARTAETRSYAGSYSDVSGRISAPRYTAYNESKDVYGKLLKNTR